MKHHNILSILFYTALNTFNFAYATDFPLHDLSFTPPSTNWTGVYAGINSGYNWSANNIASSSLWNSGGIGFNDPGGYYTRGSQPIGPIATNFTTGVFVTQPGAMDQSGFIGGAQFGYNHQYNREVVIGFEADIQGSSTRGSQTNSGVFGGAANFFSLPTPTQRMLYFDSSQIGYNVNMVTAGIDWLGTARGRVGYLLMPSLLAYGTAGLAFGGAWANIISNANNVINVTDRSNFLIGSLPSFGQTFTGGGRSSGVILGYSAGGGIEWLFSSNWSLKAEALYWNLGNVNVSTTALARDAHGPGQTFGIQGYSSPGAISGVTGINYQGVIARTGANYHFSGTEVLLPSTFFKTDQTDGSSYLEEIPKWTGIYAGLNMGYNFGSNSVSNFNLWNAGSMGFYDPSGYYSFGVQPIGPIVSNFTGGVLSTQSRSMNQSGFIGGAQFGFNSQYNKDIVIGFEADIQGSSTSGSQTNYGALGGEVNLYTPDSLTQNGWNYAINQSGYNTNLITGGLNWLGTGRGRAGYLLKPTLLVYGTAGLAYGEAWANIITNANTLINFTDNSSAFIGSLPTLGQSYTGGGHSNAILLGYSAGGGIEWLFSSDWSLKAEALYWNLGNMNITTNATANYAYGAGGTNIPSEVEGYAGSSLISGSSNVNYQGLNAKIGLNYHIHLE